MAYEIKDNAGSLFKNSRKEKDTHPDYTGQGRIDGHDYWISAWLKQSKDGNKYFSFAFKRKDGTDDRPVMDNTQAGGMAKSLDTDVPF